MNPFIAEPRPVEAAGKAPIAVAVTAHAVIAAAAGEFSADAFDPNVVVFLRRSVGVDFAHTLHQRFIGNRVQLIQRLAEKDAARCARRQGIRVEVEVPLTVCGNIDLFGSTRLTQGKTPPSLFRTADIQFV
ncbi:hypothetical protein PPO87_09965 [Neisseria gonorrhoeae]